MKKNINIISDFNTDILYNFLSQKIDKKSFTLNKPTFGFFHDKMFKSIKSKKKTHLNIVWTKVEGVINSFNKILNYEKFDYKTLIKETDLYINLIKQISRKSENVLVFSWTLPNFNKGKFLNDFTNELGVTKNLSILNNRIAETLKKEKNIFFINTNYITDQNNTDYNPKYWYLGKIPFTQKIFEVASEEILKTLNILNGKFIKLIIVDLDNTLWGGNVGDLGWQNIDLGGHSAAGEAYVDFQKKLKSLNNLGVQLAISSKNDEKKALAVFHKNQNMILRKKNFISWKINWKDKATNIKEILKDLNLSAENVLFLDDNLRERMRVKKSIKGINVPNDFDDPFFYTNILMNFGDFDLSKSITKEDSKRTKYYKENNRRKKLKEKFFSEDKWLKSLKTAVKFKKIDSSNFERAIQLLNRVNQMNLSTRRLSQGELANIKKNKKNHTFVCEISDKFGDMGIVGFFNLEIVNKKAEIKDFLLSCRAFGRDIEKGMISKIINILKSKKISSLLIKYKKTEKNTPCLNFLKKNFLEIKKNNFALKDFKNFKSAKYLNIK